MRHAFHWVTGTVATTSAKFGPVRLRYTRFLSRNVPARPVQDMATVAAVARHPVDTFEVRNWQAYDTSCPILKPDRKAAQCSPKSDRICCKDTVCSVIDIWLELLFTVSNSLDSQFSAFASGHDHEHGFGCLVGDNRPSRSGTLVTISSCSTLF